MTTAGIIFLYIFIYHLYITLKKEEYEWFAVIFFLPVIGVIIYILKNHFERKRKERIKRHMFVNELEAKAVKKSKKREK